MRPEIRAGAVEGAIRSWATKRSGVGAHLRAQGVALCRLHFPGIKHFPPGEAGGGLDDQGIQVRQGAIQGPGGTAPPGRNVREQEFLAHQRLGQRLEIRP